MATAFDSCRPKGAVSNFGYYMKLIIISLLLGSSAVTLAQDSPQPHDEVPVIAFCELVKNPKLYFDKSIRVTANLELATEGSYLRDENCVVSRDDQIGVRYTSDNDERRELINREIRKIRSIEYGSRAKVTVVGTLRNQASRSFAWYGFRFDVSRIETVSPVVLPYVGILRDGLTYSGTVRPDSLRGLVLVTPVRMKPGIATRVEWVNLEAFPALKAGDPTLESQIIFTVVSDQTTQMTEHRWNRTLELRIVSID